MNCPNCSVEIKPKTRFCPSCGANVESLSGAPLVPDVDPKIAALEKALGNKYQILRKVGSGGFADVYLGEHTQLGRQVAIKILRVAEDEEMIERFRREARAAATLSHPNIIDIYDVGDSGDTYYFVMKYIPGDTLAAKMRREKKVVPGVAIEIVKQLVDALAYAHDRGVVHRDIKPANVLIDEFGKPVLMDFGIARMAFVGQLTRTGTLMGTPHYLPPEQPLGKPVDGRSDIYSMGIMFYEMLAGRVPFHDDAAIALIYKHINEPPPPLREIAPELALELTLVVHKMIEKFQENRYQTAHDLYDALDALSVIYPALPTPSRRGTPSVNDTERLVLLAEEHKLQNKFAQALEIYGTLISRRPDDKQTQQRRDSVISLFLEEITDNIRQKEFQKARISIAEIKRLLPIDSRVEHLVLELESAEQRSSKDKEYRAHYEAAQTALKHDNASGAVEHLTRALTIDPSSEEAKTLLRGARAAYETNKRKAEFTNIFSEAEYHYNQQSFNEALAAIQRALKLEQSPQAILLEERIQAALKQKAYQDSEERNITNEVDRLCEQLNFEAASKLLHGVNAEAPQLVKTLLPKIERNQDLYQRFVDAQDRIDEGKSEEAVKFLEEFLSFPLPYEFQAFYSLRKQAEENLNTLRAKADASEFEQLLKTADTFVRLGQLSQARQICVNILVRQPDHAVAKAKLHDIDRMLNVEEIDTDELLQQIELATSEHPKTEPSAIFSQTVVAEEPRSAPSVTPPAPVVQPAIGVPSSIKVAAPPVTPKPPVKPQGAPTGRAVFGISPIMKWGLGIVGGLAVLAILWLVFWTPTEVKTDDRIDTPKIEHKTPPAPSKNDVPVVPVAQPLSVSIDVRPWAEVQITGKNLSTPVSSITPVRVELPPGEYSILCTNPDFASFSQTIHVSETERAFRLQFQKLDANQIVESILK